MTNKYFTYLLLTTISLFLLALLSFVIQPKYETSFNKGESIFDNIQDKLNNIKEISIDNKRNKISIIKDNNNWYMSSKSNYKVKNEVVRRNLIQISELRFFEKKTKEEFLYSRLDLDYPNNEEGDSKLVSIINNEDKTLVEFVLGKRKKNGVYIKKLNDQQTWLTSGILEMSSIENDWLETLILNIEYKDVKRVSIIQQNQKDSFSLEKDENNENLKINDLNKDQLPKSDLIANFLGYYFSNLIFEDVTKRKSLENSNIVTKIKFELFDDINIFAVIFNENKDKWINIDIDNKSGINLQENGKLLVSNVENWSYKLPSTKYNVSDTTLENLLVED